MNRAVVYARVSSREQEREGYSIPAQRKLLAEYARTRGFEVIREFIDVESAKNPGRKEFGNMLRILEKDPECRAVLVEKTDRLYRNRTDSLTFEEFIEKHGVEIHLVKEGRIIGKNSRSQDKFMHDIHVAVARNYVENLKEEVKKGMREKAEQGIYPGRAPIGYRNNTVTRSIDVDPEKSPAVNRIFELYATGGCSLSALRTRLLAETGLRLSRAYLEIVLKNPFYIGFFRWQGIEYRGTHTPIISVDLFERVQAVFRTHNRPKYRKHNPAFGGLLRCAHDGCTVTTEKHKGKYVYYRCSYGRGKCDLPYMREEAVSELLAGVLEDIYVPDEVVAAITGSMALDDAQAHAQREKQLASTQQRLMALRTRMDQMYDDKLDGKIDEQFWSRRVAEFRTHEIELLAASERLSATADPERILTAQRILELANKARFLYLTRKHEERGELLRKVLLNCVTDGVSLTPTYRKPFDVIFQRARNKEWSGRQDLNL